MSLIAFFIISKDSGDNVRTIYDNCQKLITDTLFRSLKYLTIYFAQYNFLRFLQRFLTFQMTYSKYSNFIYDSWSSTSKAVYYVPSTKIKFWLRDRDNLLFSKGSGKMFEGCFWRCCWAVFRFFLFSINFHDINRPHWHDGKKATKLDPLL